MNTTPTPPNPSDHEHAASYLGEVAVHVRAVLDPIKAGAKAHNHAPTGDAYAEHGRAVLRAPVQEHEATWKAARAVVEQLKLAVDALHQQVPSGTDAETTAGQAWQRLDEAEWAADATSTASTR